MRFILYTSLFVLLLTGCTATKMAPANSAPSDTVPLPDFDIQGHRGTRGLMPENTIPAMLKAVELGVNTLEMDVQITRDGQVLISHDPYINPAHELLPDGTELPAADKQKYVFYEMDYAHIRQFDVGSKFYSSFPEQQKLKTYKPLLSELIDSVQHYVRAHNLPQVFYNIEIKSRAETDGKYHPVPDEFVQRVMQVITEKDIKPWTIIQSFDVRPLQVLHAQHPEVKTALLVENMLGLEANLRKLGYTPAFYSPNYKLVTQTLVADCHRQNIKVIPWTVNKAEEIRQLKAKGVDGIITDYPNLFR